MSAIEWGRKGGKRRGEVLSQAERSKAASEAARALWAGLSKEQRSERARRAYASRGNRKLPNVVP